MSTPSKEEPEWLLTAQGATVGGLAAVDKVENAVWTYCTLLREAVFSFPEGVSVNEYDEFLEGLEQVWVDDVDCYAEEEPLEQKPILVVRFFELLKKYKKDHHPFDLLDIFSYQYKEDPAIIYEDLALPKERGAGASANGISWLEDTINNWGIKRERRGLPDIKKDETLYLGRLSAERYATMIEKNCDIWDLGGEEAPPKLPAGSLTDSANRDLPKEDSPMEVDSSEVVEPSEEPMEDHEGDVPSTRYTLRGSTLERRAKTQEAALKAATSRESSQAKESVGEKGKGKAGGESVEDNSSDGSIETNDEASDSDIYESPGTPSALVYNAKQESLWTGSIMLRKRYWMHKKCHERLKEWQLAMLPCKNCAKTGKPCVIYLALNPGCIGCMVGTGKRSCSFVPHMGQAHVPIPYSNHVGLYFHTMLISLYMQGHPLPLVPQNFEEVNFYPGITRGTKYNIVIPKDQQATVRVEAVQKWKELSKGGWKDMWYGLPYPVASQAYKDLSSRVKGVRARYAKAVWRVSDFPSDYDYEMVNKYYQTLDEVSKVATWEAFDIYKHIPYLPTPNVVAPTGEALMLYPPPQERGFSRQTWKEHVSKGGDPLYGQDSDYEEEETEADEQSGDNAGVADGEQVHVMEQDEDVPVENEEEESPEDDTGSDYPGSDDVDDGVEDDADTDRQPGTAATGGGNKRKAKQSPSEGVDDKYDTSSNAGNDEVDEPSETPTGPSMLASQSSLRGQGLFEVPPSEQAKLLSDEELMDVDDIPDSRDPSPPIGTPLAPVKARMKAKQPGTNPRPIKRARFESSGDGTSGDRNDDSEDEDDANMDAGGTQEGVQEKDSAAGVVGLVGGTQVELAEKSQKVSVGIQDIEARFKELEEAVAGLKAGSALAATVYEMKEWLDNAEKSLPEMWTQIEELKAQQDILRTRLEQSEIAFAEYRTGIEDRIPILVQQEVQRVLSTRQTNPAVAVGLASTQQVPKPDNSTGQEMSIVTAPIEKATTSSSADSHLLTHSVPPLSQLGSPHVLNPALSPSRTPSVAPSRHTTPLPTTDSISSNIHNSYGPLSPTSFARLRTRDASSAFGISGLSVLTTLSDDSPRTSVAPTQQLASASARSTSSDHTPTGPRSPRQQTSTSTHEHQDGQDFDHSISALRISAAAEETSGVQSGGGVRSHEEEM
ncbi:hypothetical protein QCA50_004716 [Cerrena zonata]|uniref:Uncharacterized protein n=2 Tax=Cerrena zonata TaxID=2478898 RepID=A0AAW0GHP9_9APHY